MPCRRTGSLAFVLAMMLALALSACGSSGVPPAAPAAAPTAAPAPKQPLPQVKIAFGTETLIYGPVFVAKEAGFFDQEGVDVKLVRVPGSDAVVQAVIGNDVDFMLTGSEGVSGPFAKGVELMAVYSPTGALTIEMVLTNAVLERIKRTTGVTPDSPILDRLKALKGIIIGVAGPGTPADLYARYFVKQGGYDPDKDVRVVSIGDVNTMRVALQKAQVDAAMGSAPFGQLLEKEGAARVFVSGSEVPGVKDMVYTMLGTRRKYATENARITRAVARAAARGNNLFLDHREDTLKYLKQFYTTLDPQLIDLSLPSIRGVIPRDGKMSVTGWQNALALHKASGIIKADLQATEGVFWTNEYVKDVQGKSK